MMSARAEQIFDEVYQDTDRQPLSNTEKKKLREALVAGLRLPMAQRGLVLTNKNGGFSKEIISGKQQFRLLFQSQKAALLIGANAEVGVFFDEVPQLYTILME